MNDNMAYEGEDLNRLRCIRHWIAFFVVALLISGITAFPIETELNLAIRMSSFLPTSLVNWLYKVHQAIKVNNKYYPFIGYGTDWLAFAHIMIAIGFIGPYIDPIRNKWVIIHAMIACVLIWPLAFIAGGVRQIPFFWQLIDCSFGVIGLIPLFIVYRKIRQLEQLRLNTSIIQ